MGLPAWFDKERQERNRRTRKQEREHAKAVGGKQQPGSGSSPRAPGDVKGSQYLDELKWTDKGSRPITLAEWEDIKRKALLMGRQPRLFIDYMRQGRPHTRLMIVEVEVGQGPSPHHP